MPVPHAGKRRYQQGNHGPKAYIVAQAEFPAAIVIKLHLTLPLAARVKPQKSEAILLDR